MIDLPPEAPPGFRSGFVTLAGRTNVGKSTLLNALVGAKVAAVTPKPQTTRRQIRGIRTGPTSQFVLVDTPGFHRPRRVLNRAMVKAAAAALHGVDLLLYVVFPRLPLSEEDLQIGRRIAAAGTPVILVVNRIDESGMGIVPAVVAEHRRLVPLRAAVAVAAATGRHLEQLVQAIETELPPGPYYFPPGVVTDQPEQVLAGEIIREKVMLELQQEVPHAAAVVVESFRPGATEGWLEIQATVVVEKDSQKKILIGRAGRQIAAIGARARHELEARLGVRIWLQLWVKVRPHWRDDPLWLRRLGFDDLPEV